jgi:glycosyltransferase involved in cell wall biosynthesis/2-polyprenyl-3-methyl-5-hydroxy-6-metoxy-1,4-benzoquinol methylase
MTKIAACLIVRNSEELIAKALTPIRPFVDEINIFDTGSTDQTVQAIRELAKHKSRRINVATGEWEDTIATARVSKDENIVNVPLAPIRVQKARKKDVPTFDNGQLADFSWAREQSYAMCSEDVDWTLWLDDDDVVIGAEHLRMFAESAHPTVDGFVFYYEYAKDEHGNTICELWRERLVRQGRNFRWINPVHEVYLPEPNPPNFVKVEPSMVRYVHERGAGDRYPSERNLLILERAAEEAEARGEAPDPRTKIYIGTELMARGRFAESELHLKEYLLDGRTIVSGDERVQAAHKLALCLRSLGRAGEAVDVEFEALKERDDWLENVVGLADAFSELQNWPRCEYWARRAIELPRNETILIINPIELSFLPRYRLAQACAVMGRWDESEKWLAEAAKILPGHPILQETIAGFGRAKLEHEAAKALLTLREVCIRFDENFKAFNLMENAPYIIAERPEIVSAKAMTKENVLHALRPDEYKRWYEDEPKESTVPDEWVPIAGDYIERVKFVLELCQSFEAEHGRKPRVLDLGCNDFWQAGYLWKNGEYVCDGIELNKASVEKAAGRVERFGMPGRIVQGDLHDAVELLNMGSSMAQEHSYDIVTCFEVYEHVPDTDRLLEVMEELTAPGGYICLTTPNGAFEQGQLQFWHLVERKGHLRATPIHELAKQIMGRGEVVDLRLHQGERLVYACYQPGPKKGKVILWGGGAWEEWSPRSVREGGIGGSETMLSILAVRLGNEGYEVTVYSDATPGWYAGSLWRPSAAFDPSEEADAIIVSRNPEVFGVELHAPVRALWCHDMGYPNLTEALSERMTHVVVLSEWQRERFAKEYPWLEDKLRVIGNGVLLEEEDRFPAEEVARGFSERKPRAIYSSSADRGLEVLFEVWPRIREQVPEAELHVFYGWDTLDKVALLNPALQEFKRHVLWLYDAAGGEAAGIHMRGRMGQIDLYREMREARVWAYPTAFLETSCITAMEARANGLAVVTSDLGALSETVGGHGILIPWGDDEYEPCNALDRYKDEFVANVSAALSEEDTWTQLHDLAREDIEDHGFDRRLSQWEALIALSTVLA